MKFLQSALRCGILKVGGEPAWNGMGRTHTQRLKGYSWVISHMNYLHIQNQVSPFRVIIFQRFLLVPCRILILKEKQVLYVSVQKREMWSNYPFRGVAEDALTFTFYHRKAKRDLLFFHGIKMTKSI